MMSKNAAIIISIVLIAALTLGCTEPTVLPTDMGDPATREALTEAKDNALQYIEKHPYYNSVFVESPAKVMDGYITETVDDPNYEHIQYQVRVYIDFSEKHFNKTTGSMTVVPHRVYMQLTHYSNSNKSRINEAAMDGEYDLLNYRPLMGESVRK